MLDAEPLGAHSKSTWLPQIFTAQQTQTFLPKEFARFSLTAFGPNLLRMTPLIRAVADAKRSLDEIEASSEPQDVTHPVPSAR